MRSLIIILFLAAMTSGCSLIHSKAAKNPKPRPVTAAPVIVDNGYALLLDLMGDEKDVSKLLIIKRDHDDLHEVIKAISKRCGAAHVDIQNYFKLEGRDAAKHLGLPPAEVETRKSISAAHEKELLGSKGKDLELLLLLSQNEALAYGTHLALVIAKSETNQTRVKSMQQLSNDLDQLRQKVVAFLLSKYDWSK